MSHLFWFWELPLIIPTRIKVVFVNIIRYMCAISENKPLKQRNLYCMTCVNVMSLQYSKAVAIDSYLQLILNNNNNNNCIDGRVHYYVLKLRYRAFVRAESSARCFT